MCGQPALHGPSDTKCVTDPTKCSVSCSSQHRAPTSQTLTPLLAPSALVPVFSPKEKSLGEASPGSWDCPPTPELPLGPHIQNCSSFPSPKRISGEQSPHQEFQLFLPSPAGQGRQWDHFLQGDTSTHCLSSLCPGMLLQWLPAALLTCSRAQPKTSLMNKW